jgi:hypothetical protein
MIGSPISIKITCKFWIVLAESENKVHNYFHILRCSSINILNLGLVSLSVRNAVSELDHRVWIEYRFDRDDAD